MTAANSGLMIQRQGDVQVIEFLDSSLLDQANIEKIHVQLKELVERSGHPKLVVSFEGVSYISSAVLGVLLSVNKLVAAQRGELRLAHISPKILEVFKLTRLDKILKVFPTAKDALAKF